MAKHQIEVNGKLIIPLSQQDIADIVQLSKKKVNLIIGELRDNEYILQQSPSRGKYILTEKAHNVVSQIHNEGIKK